MIPWPYKALLLVAIVLHLLKERQMDNVLGMSGGGPGDDGGGVKKNSKRPVKPKK